MIFNGKTADPNVSLNLTHLHDTKKSCNGTILIGFGGFSVEI